MSDDYTESQTAITPRASHGKAMSSRLTEATGKASGKTVAAEMANPKVQSYNGNVAILTYSYVGVTQDKEGKTELDPCKIHSRLCEKGQQIGRWSTQTLRRTPLLKTIRRLKI